MSKGFDAMRFVLRIGGSVIASPIDSVLISRYADLLKRLKTQGHDVVVIIGGGALAREFIGVAKDLGLDERSQDEVAISISRIFAQLFLQRLGELGCEAIPLTIEDTVKCLHEGKITVMGGLKPGMTTDTVAALVVEQINAELFIKATDQEGIYDKDPRKHVDAVKFEHISFDDLLHVFDEDKHKAGIHQILDPEAVKILRKGIVKVVIVNGFEPENILLAIKGEKIGTTIL